MGRKMNVVERDFLGRVKINVRWEVEVGDLDCWVLSLLSMVGWMHYDGSFYRYHDRRGKMENNEMRS